MRLRKVCRGKYELVGITHTVPSYVGDQVCHGQVFAEWFPDSKVDEDSQDASWECYCERCGWCDPNGWPTLRDCVREASAFWCREETR